MTRSRLGLSMAKRVAARRRHARTRFLLARAQAAQEVVQGAPQGLLVSVRDHRLLVPRRPRRLRNYRPDRFFRDWPNVWTDDAWPSMVPTPVEGHMVQDGEETRNHWATPFSINSRRSVPPTAEGSPYPSFHPSRPTSYGFESRGVEYPTAPASYLAQQTGRNSMGSLSPGFLENLPVLDPQVRHNYNMQGYDQLPLAQFDNYLRPVRNFFSGTRDLLRSGYNAVRPIAVPAMATFAAYGLARSIGSQMGLPVDQIVAMLAIVQGLHPGMDTGSATNLAIEMLTRSAGSK